LHWKIRIKNNESIKEINKEVINKIKTDVIPQINDIFNSLEANWDIIKDNMILHETTLFLIIIINILSLFFNFFIK